MKNLNEMTEKELREVKDFWPKSDGELTDYINKLVNRPHDYGTCVYAMSLAAVAAFNYVAGKLGVTGFQASMADLDFIRRTRRLEMFSIIDFENLLYPQYLNKENFPNLQQLISKNAAWLKEKAAKKLSEIDPNNPVHPDVKSHWEYLASLELLN